MELPTGTLTLVFTDIQDSSEHSERYREAFEPLRATHFQILRELMARWNGHEVSTAGDALFLVFSNASDAVKWAVEAQRSLSQYDWPTLAPAGGSEPPARVEVRVRIGMHTGEPFLSLDSTRQDYFGPVVNRAARVSSAAHGRQILVSSATHALVQFDLPDDITFLDCGTHRLKGVGEDRLQQVLAPGLISEFPSLKTLDPGRHNLPVPPTAYMGREEELRAWLEKLRQPTTRVLTLTGFGGMGKTRSALHMAELSLDDYKDGVCWVELEEARTGEEMIGRIAASLRMPPPPYRDQVIQFLKDRDLLLVLDNTEQVPDAGRVVKDLLAKAPRIKFLVTSRRPLEIQAERVIELDPLPPADAVQLFAGRVRDRQPEFELTPENTSDVLELCARLDGVPLALELAASRIAMMAPRQMLQRLNERFKLLQTRAPDLPERQRALRAAIDWSYGLLSDDDKSLFAQVSVFAGGFDLEDVEAVCDAFDVLEGVAELRRHSLLRSETEAETQQTRFLMLNSLREYAQERLDATPEAGAARLRHARYFLEYARKRLKQMRTSGEAAALRELAINADNLRAAMEYADKEGDSALFADLGLMRGRALWRRGYSEDALQPVQAALDAARQNEEGNPILYAKLLEEFAGLCSDQHDLVRADSLAHEALGIFSRLQNDPGQARLENLLGIIARELQDFDLARQFFEKALSRLRSPEDDTEIGNIHGNLGLTVASDAEGTPEEANLHYQKALVLRRKQGDTRGLAETLNNLGVLSYRQADWTQAWQYYAEALEHEQVLGNTLGIARALFNLAEVAEERSQVAEALRLAAASEVLMDLIKSPLIQHPTELIDCIVATAGAGVQAEATRQAACGKSLQTLVLWALGELPEVTH